MKTIEELGISLWPWRTGHDAISVICGKSLDKTFDLVSFGRTPYNSILRCKYRANARLIASAPELYECLRDAVEDKCEVCKNSCHGNCVTKDGSPCSKVKKWIETLAKASGEEMRHD